MKLAIVGAGRTGRGFIARLLAGQAQLIFFDKNRALIDELRLRGEYTVRYYDAREPDRISGYTAYHTEDPACAKILCGCDCVFVSVGGENTAAAGEWLARYIEPDTCVIACENAACPAELFGGSFGARACSGAVFCTSTEAGDTLDIISENYPALYTDGNIPAAVAALRGIEPVADFATLMRRKIYTYNAASAIIAYLGTEKGYELYSDAANDLEIAHLLDGFYEQINRAICAEYGTGPEEQRQFALLSKEKFQNRNIVDSVSRNAASPLRKLGPSERIIEPARLILRHGGDADALARTAAAAIRYMGVKGAPETSKLLKKTCALNEDELLYQMIMKEIGL